MMSTRLPSFQKNEPEWGTRHIVLKDKKGNISDEFDAEFPTHWTDISCKVVADKYFRAVPDGCGGRVKERSLKSVVHRIAFTITEWGRLDGYFQDLEESDVFYQSLYSIMVWQYACFNSPVLFNVGVQENPQTSACFINPVDDSMESIADWYSTSMLVYKGGSGLGSNVSALRASTEPLSIGGKSSGPISFIKSADSIAGSIKSGGASRRAATITIMDMDHPDIEAFIDMKAHEEKKAHALLEAGYSGGIEGEAYSTVAFQNMNVSTRATNAFMLAAKESRPWDLIERVSKKVARTVNARDLLLRCAERTHECGDPGIQFHDTVNRWNTCKASGVLRASNPCQPGYATVLTPQGIRTFDAIDVDSVIWSGSQWTKVLKKWSTGVKAVYRFSTSFGEFIGTKDHRVVSNGIKTKASKAACIDVCVGESLPRDFAFDLQAVVDGFVFGDGSIHRASQNKVHAYFGAKDTDVKHYLASFMGRCRDAFCSRGSHEAYEMITTITARELPKTYNRVIPSRFFCGDNRAVCSFLRGLYSANGSVITGERIALKATSKHVILQVQKMLSSVGIRSYYTTNKSKKSEFANGIYVCRESYDLCITRDRLLFMNLIGFIQDYKNDSLKIFNSSPKSTAYLIREKEYVEDCEVFDITVDCEDHTYWTGGCLVSNCAEYIFDLYEGWGACNLASINLLKFYNIGFEYSFDWPQFETVVRIMITAMDILIDQSGWPHPKLGEAARAFRPLGLGYSNLASLFMINLLPYASEAAQEMASTITRNMTKYAYKASVELARRKGAFNHFAENEESFREVLTAHGIDVWELVTDDYKGIRNSQVTLLAPTGTISFFMGCDSYGMEPFYSLVTWKEFIGGMIEKIPISIVDTALSRLGVTSLSDVPENRRDIFRTASFDPDLPQFPALEPLDHIHMMEAVQPFISGAISKTVNLPESATVQDIFDTYMYAWELGLKSITVYRDGSKIFQPLSSTEQRGSGIRKLSADAIFKAFESCDTSERGLFVEKFSEMIPLYPRRRKLPSNRMSTTHSFQIGDFKGTLHIGFYPDTKKVGEVFVTASKSGTTINGLLDCFAICFSYALQYGVPLSVLTRKFSYQRFEPDGWTSNPAISHAHSIVDYIARMLDTEYNDAKAEDREWLFTPCQSSRVAPVLVKDTYGDAKTAQDFDAPPCAKCGTIMRRVGACHTCMNCGESSGCG